MGPEFRRPPVGPRRSTWPYRFAELFFGTIAKATMVIAVLLLVALEIFSGGTGGGIGDFPTTRRGWRNLLLVMLTILIVVALGIYFFPPMASRPHR
ncbi:hypothetical protein OKW50_005251 [Paraburkholderia youngii]